MSFSYYLQVIVSLLVFVGVLYGVLHVSKRLKLQKYTGEIKVKDRLSIDNGVSLMIVTVKNQEIFLSVTQKNVKVIKKWED